MVGRVSTLVGWGGEHNAHVVATVKHAALVSGIPPHVLWSLGLTEVIRILERL